MELPEDDSGLSEDDKLFEARASNGDQSSISQEPGRPEEPNIDLEGMDLPQG